MVGTRCPTGSASWFNAGVMTKRFYQDNLPRYEYLLTDMGPRLLPGPRGHFTSSG